MCVCVFVMSMTAPSAHLHSHLLDRSLATSRATSCSRGKKRNQTWRRLTVPARRRAFHSTLGPNFKASETGEHVGGRRRVPEAAVPAECATSPETTGFELKSDSRRAVHSGLSGSLLNKLIL